VGVTPDGMVYIREIPAFAGMTGKFHSRLCGEFFSSHFQFSTFNFQLKMDASLRSA
jgi:hypothetical protein